MLNASEKDRWMDGWVHSGFNSDSHVMPGNMVSCCHIYFNTAGFRQVCPGSKDGEATGFKPDRAKASLARRDEAHTCANSKHASVTSTHHWVRSIHVKSQVALH